MAKKATRVRYSGTAPFVDDTQVNRVQALGASSRLTTMDMKELGTLNIVEIVDDVPQVDISMDQNENGTNDLVGLFANKGYGCNVVAVPSGGAVGSKQIEVRPGTYFVGAGEGNRVLFEGATLNISGSSGDQYVYLRPQLSGNQVGVGGSVPNGAVEIATIASQAVSSGVITQADITDNRAFKKVTSEDYELAMVDIFVPVKQSGSGSEIQRTMYMERAYLNNVDFSFQTNGVVTSSYRLETDNKRWFLSQSAQIVVDQFKTTTSASLTLSQSPNQLRNSNYMLTVIKNGEELEEGVDFTVSGTTLTLTQPPSSGDFVKARYTAADGGDFFQPVPAVEDPHPELAGGLREGQVEIYMSDKANERVARITSASIGMPLSREQLDELGSLAPYARPLELPIDLSISLELRDSDLEMMARFAGYSSLDNVDEIAITDLVKDLDLTVKLYRENDIERAKLPAGHPDKYAIKTFEVTNLIPQNESWDVRVESDATQSFDFTAHNLSVSDEIVA